MRRLMAVLLDESHCPNCDGKLKVADVGHYVCVRCSAMVDYERGAWKFSHEVVWRGLPGWMGRVFKFVPVQKAVA